MRCTSVVHTKHGQAAGEALLPKGGWFQCCSTAQSYLQNNLPLRKLPDAQAGGVGRHGVEQCGLGVAAAHLVQQPRHCIRCQLGRLEGPGGTTGSGKQLDGAGGRLLFAVPVC